MGFVELIKVERDHANEGQPQHDGVEDFPARAGPYLSRIEGYFEKIQDDCQVRNLMREEPDYPQSLVPTSLTAGHDGRRIPMVL